MTEHAMSNADVAAANAANLNAPVLNRPGVITSSPTGMPGDAGPSACIAADRALVLVSRAPAPATNGKGPGTTVKWYRRGPDAATRAGASCVPADYTTRP